MASDTLPPRKPHPSLCLEDRPGEPGRRVGHEAAVIEHGAVGSEAGLGIGNSEFEAWADTLDEAGFADLPVLPKTSPLAGLPD